MKTQSRVHGWQDAVEIVLIAWLWLSPFVLGFFGRMEASLTAVMIAAISSLFTQLGVATQKPVDEWINLALALALIASPWVLGYSDLTLATGNAVIVGTLFGIFAVLAMIHDYAFIKEERHAEQQ